MQIPTAPPITFYAPHRHHHGSAHLSTTTELVVLNPVPQHDPHPDPEFASHGGSRLPQTLLD